MNKLTQYYLKSILRYEPETGNMYRLVTTSPRSQIGAIAGNFHKSNGYIRLMVNGRDLLAHRVIWFMHHGEWPHSIDHIDHDKTNNRLENLRAVDHKENMKNRPMSPRNTSGITGVSWAKTKNQWLAQIKGENKRIHLGYHDSLIDAASARKSAEIEHKYHANHGVNHASP